MEALCDLRRALLPRVPRVSLFRPVKPFSVIVFSQEPFPSSGFPTFRRPYLSVRAFGGPLSSVPPSSKGETSDGAVFSLLKPLCVVLAIGAALFSGLHKPSAALAVPPVAESDTLPSPSPATEESEDLSEEEKERSLEDYLETYPEDTKSLRALMKLKIKAQKLPEAIAIVDRLILLEPGEKDLFLLKGHLQSYGGDTETAKQMFEEVLRKDPLFVEAYHGLVMAAASGSESEGFALTGILERIQGAMELCKKEKKKEELRDFKLLVAQVRVMEGMYEEALEVYQELVKEEPRDFRPYLCQGIIYTLLRKKDEAGKQFQKYRRLVPKGHPYAQYFDENMKAMNIFPQMDGKAKTASLQR
ncbi:unnamed protein product [Spirodela intermedia]|uniref:Uncharacterized protein n=1 Tax=Spirodela intermedia TaxID=51605 RepID=A0A7I8IGL2_SPIIN|nr:unnamed protein product [Spirodela intermedia]CAA6656843.1 unnamed protein product [Spirodela intermedia]